MSRIETITNEVYIALVLEAVFMCHSPRITEPCSLHLIVFQLLLFGSSLAVANVNALQSMWLGLVLFTICYAPYPANCAETISKLLLLCTTSILVVK
jgi:hypothetical protein